jgi:hypothetical protein
MPPGIQTMSPVQLSSDGRWFRSMSVRSNVMAFSPIQFEALAAAAWRQSWASIEHIGRPFPLQTHRAFRCAEWNSISQPFFPFLLCTLFLSAIVSIVRNALIEDLHTRASTISTR